MTYSVHSVEKSHTQTTKSGSFMQVYVQEYQIIITNYCTHMTDPSTFSSSSHKVK